jgi:phosphatidylserine decarboxylase
MTLEKRKWIKKVTGYGLLVIAIFLLTSMYVLLQLGIVTDHLYHATVKDPERKIPGGRVIVSPSDGTILYIKKISAGMIPEVTKAGVPIPLEEHMKMKPPHSLTEGYLIGIFMNTQGVHINRIPDDGIVQRLHRFNGPHMDMTETEKEVIVAQLIPGLLTARKVLGLPPFNIRKNSEYILKSARETMIIKDSRGTSLCIVRIADYYVGKILTWVKPGARVKRGQKLGMIAWGSQTDLFIESSPGLVIKVRIGEYVYGGETVIGKY